MTGHWIGYSKDHAAFFPQGTNCVYDTEKELHNISGPAVIFRDGFSMWFFHGHRIIKYDHLRILADHSDETMTALKLKYGAIDTSPVKGLPWH